MPRNLPRPVRRPSPSRSFRPTLEELESRLTPSANVLTYHNDLGRDGQNPNETVLTPANVNASTFGKQFTTGVDGDIFAQPLFMSGVNITTGPSPGVHDVVFVATEHDSLYALDANTGQVLWRDSFLTGLPGATVTPIPAADVSSGGVGPEVGITSTPVIDGATQTLYVVTATKEVLSGNNHYIQRMHAINLADGSEKVAPTVVADTSYNGGVFTYNSGPTVNGTGDGSVGGKVTYNAVRQLTRAALTLTGGRVYLATAGHSGDINPYHGWVVGFDAASLQLKAAFNSTPNGSEGGIWQSGSGVAVDPQGFLYVVTGNGTFDAPGVSGQSDYGDSVIKLAVDPTTTSTNQNLNGWGLRVVDYFTPYNQAALSSGDVDLGSVSPLILPDAVGDAAHPHLLVAAGKAGTIYLIDRDNMGGYNAGGTTDHVVQTLAGAIGGDYGTPAFFNNTLYYVTPGAHAKAFTIADGSAQITAAPASLSPDSFAYPGSVPSISSNSGAQGVVWDLDRGTGQLRAYDAANYANELYTSAQDGSRDALGSLVGFAVPTVANGHVFVGAANTLVGYGLFGSSQPVLTANERFVEALYNDFLGRAGATTELDYWVNQMAAVGAAGVVSRIEHSTEASQRLAVGYYEQFLGRAPGAGEENGWVNLLTQPGTTQEQVMVGFFTSPEFAARANALFGSPDANTNFVMALYSLLLHRTGSSVSADEVNGWLSRLPALGRQGVAAAFLASQEFRSDAVRTFYNDPSLPVLPTQPFLPELLHRTAPPPAGDVSGWVNSPLDLFGIEIGFASGPEFFN